MPLPRSVRRAIHCWLFALPMGTALVRPALAEEEPKGLAREHYARGVALAKVGAYDQALAEFTRAYELVPHYAVLYNVGQAYLELGRKAKAVESLELYLKLGAANVPPERRKEVEAVIAELSAELAAVQVTVDQQRAPVSVEAETPPRAFGFVTVRCATAGVSIAVDGTAVAVTPISRPLQLEAGSHRLSFSRSLSAARVIDVRVEGAQQTAVDCGDWTTARAAPETTTRSTTQRTFGYALGALGLGLGGAAVAHWRWNAGRYDDWQSAYADYDSNPAPAPGERDAVNAQANSIERASAVTVGLGVAAVLSLGTGIVLLVTDGGQSHSGANGGARKRSAAACASPLVGFCSRW